MKTFWTWLENQNITVDYTNFTKTINLVAEKTIDHLNEKKYQLSIFNSEQFLTKIQKELVNYPNLNNLIQALKSKNRHYIFDHQRKIYDWARNQPNYLNLRELINQIWTYMDYVNPSPEFGENEVWEQVKQLTLKTQQEIEKIKKIIEEAISRISNWNNSPIKMEVNPPEDVNGPILDFGDSAYVYVGIGEMAPTFSFFQIDGKIEIEDIIEGGDQDFFENPKIQADYFNLINELKNPNSTNKGKILTLYTARPTKDRQQLMNSKTLPVNVFLTNDYEHAEGLAIDLAGSDKPRDIWKIKIDSKYLTQTLDGPIKYYQVTSDALVKNMELIYSSMSGL